MKKRHLVLAALFTLAAFCHSALTMERNRVRVRLAKDLHRVALSGHNLQFEQTEKINPYSRVAIPRMQNVEVVLSSLKNGKPPFWMVKKPEETEAGIRIFSKVLHVSGSRVKLGFEPVPSRIRLVPNRRGKIDVIAELDIETYLAGVLPSEMPAAWPLEALKAQAVASRTYMRKKMQERSRIHFDLEASVHDQVFKAMQLKNEHPSYQRKVARALAETRGVVLKNRKGRYLTAYYHADCGGLTESPTEVWGMDGTDHQRVKDPYCQNRKASRWQVALPKDSVAEKLARYFKVFVDPQLESIFVSRKTQGLRNGDLSVIFKDRLPQKISAQDLRALVGFDKVRSTRFSLVEKKGYLVFAGSGNGHGVGLCQHGTKKLALRGWGHRAILEHYYPKAKISVEKMPGDILAAPRLGRGKAKKMRVRSL